MGFQVLYYVSTGIPTLKKTAKYFYEIVHVAYFTFLYYQEGGRARRNQIPTKIDLEVCFSGKASHGELNEIANKRERRSAQKTKAYAT